ncbi:MAG: filamentous hemagglutinin N-terminal domain-containing protein [Proteobacteria bacterium]|nr:filamentous hemagglutinin N-terminal domain-containing protein [Pseudomonadota bacterium]
MANHRDQQTKPGYLRRTLLPLAAACSLPCLPSARANPEGLVVRAGTANATTSGSTLTIQAGNQTFLDWRSFNIAPGETTRFVQPSATSIAWNRINDPNPSRIFGHLEANGVLVLANQSGFFFGPDSFVRAAGLAVTTAPIAPDMIGGGAWQFATMPPLASIINYGTLQAENGGSLYLVAEKIFNHGILTAPDGNIGLYAGKSVLISERPDGRGLSAQVSLPEGTVDNQGRLIADAGTIALHAQVVNQGGVIQANTVRNVGGVIELVAGDTVNLQAGSTILAQGTEPGAHGGEVRIKAGNSFTDTAGSAIDVSGSATGGDGGRVALSAPHMGGIASSILARAGQGSKGGELVIDPQDIFIDNGGAGSVASGQVNQADPPAADALTIAPSAFSSFSQITLQATRDISVNSAWNSFASADPNGSILRLQAGRDINVNNSITVPNNWSVELVAGSNFTVPNSANPAAAVNAGVGSLNFINTGSVQAQDGHLSLYAGLNVALDGGFARTVAGGNINVLAAMGDVNTGLGNVGYSFARSGYRVNLTGLGGISTGAGGDVKIKAGGSVVSYLPTGSSETDAGTGAFGSAPGNISIEAGADVTGHYVVANGTGSILAHGNAGTPQQLLALSLVKGAWSVVSDFDINLQEVRNPNGAFNSSVGANNHRFDYDPTAAVFLTAGNALNLSGDNRPVPSDVTIPSPIYPPSLTLRAGAGGINVANDLILFPAPLANLDIGTTGGGSLSGVNAQGSIVKIIMSDSGKNRISDVADFGETDHAAIPVHLGDPNPVKVAINGDLNNITLVTPKKAEITVHGNLLNAGLSAQNLSPLDETILTVDGDIKNRVPYTFFDNIGTAPDFNVFNSAYPAFTSNPFLYNAQTHRLIFQGKMTFDQLQAFQNIQVPVLDANGNPVLLDSHGNVVLVDSQGHPLEPTETTVQTRAAQFLPANIIQKLFADSQDVPQQSGTGYTISGPGRFTINARNADLGDTAGIVSKGPQDNFAVAALGPAANISLNLSGDLNMFASRIVSVAGGNLDLTIAGKVQLGSPDSAITFKSDPGRGIFSASSGDINLTAGGDINVQDSRIASYDGGNLFVKSLNGNVNAGDGRVDTQTVSQFRVDPVTGAVTSLTRVIPGSGLIATTFPDSPNNTVGNITVETPNGSIIAGSGGIVQVNLSKTPAPGGRVSLTAGTEVGGVVTSPGDINVSGSGVIGVNVSLKATGNISGVAVAQQNIDISSRQSVSISALGGGDVKASASGTISGTLVGVSGVSASGTSVDANVLSQNVAASTTTSGQKGFTQTAAASNTAQAAAQAEPAKAAAAKPAMQDPAATTDPEEKKKKALAKPVLTRTTGRVTVILPGK